ncbi:neither inactivation nor afterpotential protein C [Planoprotostelium fungivorum]|uniref:Neither inactivation nor afterpotential protein C n=1 Tax=Planoprotostelium fungivorum TaxID=1890364 RepID=A0A2P6MP36_9EUKA|nr:neither inactivation nor afterpotential protein C [Planoprotostelium fungivorum]
MDRSSRVRVNINTLAARSRATFVVLGMYLFKCPRRQNSVSGLHQGYFRRKNKSPVDSTKHQHQHQHHSPLSRLVSRLSRRMSGDLKIATPPASPSESEQVETIHCSSTSGDSVWFDPKSYHQIRNLGKGNYGRVDLVESNGSRFALKEQKVKRSGFNSEVTLHLKVVIHYDTHSRLIPLQISKAGDHENVARLYYASSSRHRTGLIALEYCEGVCLDQLNGCLIEQQIRYIIREVVKGLTFLHSINIVHRDIKPDNIMITIGGQVKLIDLGMADDYTSHLLTDPCGSPLYMAPEHINCIDHPAPYNEKVDIWSVGITCIELATARLPHFDAKKQEKLISSVVHGPAPTLSQSQAEAKNTKYYNQSFHDFVGFCLNKNPNERPSAAQLLEHPFLMEKTGTAEVNSLRDTIRMKMDHHHHR